MRVVYLAGSFSGGTAVYDAIDSLTVRLIGISETITISVLDVLAVIGEVAAWLTPVATQFAYAFLSITNTILMGTIAFLRATMVLFRGITEALRAMYAGIEWVRWVIESFSISITSCINEISGREPIELPLPPFPGPSE